jgi:dTDP-4-dehydrorhamnose reductase
MATQLVIGASGQVGHHLTRAAESRGHDVVATRWRTPLAGAESLDIRDGGAVARLVAEISPAVVYLPAYFANVDACELDPASAYETNVVGVANVVEAANRAGAKLVFFSSDYVFDGSAGPYREDNLPHPLSAYGRQKLIGEHVVATRAADWLVVRTTGVYGWEPQAKNFVCGILAAFGRNETVQVPYDQIGTPTYAPGLAQATLELATRGATGVYNVAGSGLVARDAFARAAAEAFGYDPRLVTPVATADQGRPAPRPLRAGLVVDKAAAELGAELFPDYRVGLERMRAEQAA